MPTSIVVLQKDPQKFEILWVWLFMPCGKGKVVIQTCYMKISIMRCLLSKGKQPNADFANCRNDRRFCFNGKMLILFCCLERGVILTVYPPPTAI